MANVKPKSSRRKLVLSTVKAELEQRGYSVAVCPSRKSNAHLSVTSTSRNAFFIRVYSLKIQNFWILPNAEINNTILYILVYLPIEGPARFFIITSPELMKERQDYKKHIESISDTYQDRFGGINWTTALPYEDRWKVLPK